MDACRRYCVKRYLLDSLLASPGDVAAILQRFEDEPKLVLVFQRTYWRVKSSLGWKGNKRSNKARMWRMELEERLPILPQFPAGNMFWARASAVMLMFRMGLTIDDFPGEMKRLDVTTAHATERCWGCEAIAQGYYA